MNNWKGFNIVLKVMGVIYTNTQNMYLGLPQTFKMDHFVTIVNVYKPLTL